MLEKLFINPKPLDKDSDRELRIRPLTNFKHSDGVNIVPLYAGEILEASKRYPVVFAKDVNGYMPIAILGHTEGVNNFVDKQGTWREECYIPALLRTYPFAVAENDGNFFIVADRAYKGFAGDGERIFNEDGTPTELGESIVKNVSEVFSALRFTSGLINELGELFKEVSMSFEKNGKRFELTDVKIIDEEKLNALDGAKLAELREKKLLPIIYQHLLSLSNRV